MMTKIAFVRKKEIPPSAPPITEVGLIGWLRQNLFSSWLNSILTVLSVYFIVIILWDFIPWAYGGHWNTKSLRECLDLDPDVACFSVLTARWKQLLFGLYPAEEYWLSLIHISEPTRLLSISYAVFCLKKKNRHQHFLQGYQKPWLQW